MRCNCLQHLRGNVILVKFQEHLQPIGLSEQLPESFKARLLAQEEEDAVAHRNEQLRRPGEARNFFEVRF
jgi:hypothetical protein